MPAATTYEAMRPDRNNQVAYSDAEHAVWRDLHARQIERVRCCAAPEYLAGLDRLDLPSDRIPQCTDVSEVLQSMTGWRVEAVPALIGFGRFFDLLANRRFPAASFIRNRRDFDYIEEPDIFHEIFGHTPLLTDPRFARFSEAIGCAGQRAGPVDYAWLIRLYWFTIEFGLTCFKDKFKALGAGLVSSPGELGYGVTSAVPCRRGFDVMDILRTPYRIDIQQPVYYVMDDLNALFDAADRDLLADVRQARSLGEFPPLFAPRQEVT